MLVGRITPGRWALKDVSVAYRKFYLLQRPISHRESSMPAFEIDTNVSEDKITPQITMELTELLAEMLSLDVKFLSVIFRPNPRMVWAGTAEPCAVCRLTAINNIDEEHNRGYTEKIFKFMHDKFGVPGDRMYSIFVTPGASNVGYTGRLFSDMS
ncbi:macrophage migration inhibitory factor homolog isoform X1 [Amphibalanus amphitrite]|uniref:macrophage migration inhibitory factor homolog isoform X1 n=2 Tax=Amphibalanus amphitrite TaxID=1232801 RepID=UPI001C920F30|nr:macrophage migration inhibitory factor homolog isoform X1 [Amphibalanus amphitrite]